MNKSFASKLRQRITIEEPVYTSDLLGGFITAWNSYAILWAEVLSAAKGSRIKADKVDESNLLRITVRYVPGVTSKMRINYKSKYYSIRSVVNIGERNERLEITASEVA